MVSGQGLVTRGFTANTIVVRGLTSSAGTVVSPPVLPRFVSGRRSREVEKQVFTMLVSARLIKVNDERIENVYGSASTKYVEETLTTKPRILITNVQTTIIETTRRIFIEVKNIISGRRK